MLLSLLSATLLAAPIQPPGIAPEELTDPVGAEAEAPRSLAAAEEAPKPPAQAGVAPAADDDSGDDDEVESKDSEELEAMKALEEAALDPSSKPKAQVLQSLSHLGVGNPLKLRLEDNLEDSDLAEALSETELSFVGDVLNFDVRSVAREYDIPVEMQPLVAQYIQFFRGPGRKWFRKWMSRSSRYIPAMAPILESNGVPRDTVYLAMIESGFSNSAYSWARAAGPWQFISKTGKLFGLKQDFWVDERKDPLKSTLAAARYLKRLREELGDWYLAWAGYNAGGERVRRVMQRKGTSDFWEVSDGRGLAKETKHYVPKLIACALVAKHPKAFGFKDDEFQYEPPIDFEEVKLVDPTDLEVIAKAAQVDLDDVKELNPELRRWCTPPATSQKPYVLRLPKGSAARFAENYARIAPAERLTFKVHRIHRGDTLSQIARTYHTAPEAILQLNRLRNARSLRVNSDLVIPVSPGKASAMPDAKLATVLEHQAAKARRSGFVAAAPEEEIPAGTATTRSAALGPLKSEVVNGKQRLTYGVQSGDTLWSLSQRFNCSVEDLRRWNHLNKRRRGLRVGVALSIWPGVNVPVENRGGTLVAGTPAAAKEEAAPSASVPAPSKAPTAVSASSDTHKHRLEPGETLWSISRTYGVSVEDLKRWNGIKEDRSIRAGQELTLVAP